MIERSWAQLAGQVTPHFDVYPMEYTVP